MFNTLLALLILAAGSPENDLQRMDLKGKVKSATTIHHVSTGNNIDSLVFNEDGNVLADYLVDAKGFCWQGAVSIYENGRLKTRNCYLDNELNSIMRYSYDKRGNLVSLHVNDTLDGYTSRYVTLFTYNKQNQMTSLTEKSGNEVNEKCTFKYDKRGNEIEKQSSRGTRELYTYDAGNHMIERKDYRDTTLIYTEINKYSSDGQLVCTEKIFNYDTWSRYVFTFGPDGNKLVRDRFDDEGTETIHFSYEYDDHHNWIREIQTIDGKEVNRYERRIIYYQ